MRPNASTRLRFAEMRILGFECARLLDRADALASDCDAIRLPDRADPPAFGFEIFLFPIANGIIPPELT